VDLYVHSSIRLYGVVLNLLSTLTTFFLITKNEILVYFVKENFFYFVKIDSHNNKNRHKYE
jgi:hypothetical protein